MRVIVGILLMGIMLVTGCRTIEPEPVPPLSLEIPGTYSIASAGKEAIDNWWHIFDSEELDGLIKNAVDHNFDLISLKTRMAQTKARIEKEEASFFPDLGFSLGGQRKETQVKKTHGSAATNTGSHSWDGSLSASYTADIWGEADAGKQAEVSNLEAAGQDLKASILDLTGEIAQTWIDIISTRSKKNILANQININKTLLELQKLRFANGKADALDVSQQREALAEASSQVPLLEKQERVLLNKLAFLSGISDSSKIMVTQNKLPDPIPLPRVGIPSDLLENRPDILAAGMRLSSSQWEVTAARADLLPSFKLTAQALFSSGSLDLLFQNWVATLTGSIAGPIFDGGLKKAEIKRLKAVAEEQVNFYARTVAAAIIEVEDRLIGIQKQEAYVKLLEEELAVVRLTLRDAMLQYQNGKSSYLSYLIAWSSIERLERQLVGEKAMILKERVGLFQALGWKFLPEPE